VLGRKPDSSVATALQYKKFLRSGRDRAAESTEVMVATAVELPIERGTTGPFPLAHTIVRRWQDPSLTRLTERCKQVGWYWCREGMTT